MRQLSRNSCKLGLLPLQPFIPGDDYLQSGHFLETIWAKDGCGIVTAQKKDILPGTVEKIRDYTHTHVCTHTHND
ncbi:cerebral cavernous malformations 2 protein-like [Herpailurus yagouaroundi]|uniref:cerebral cavernous malformations 2 protein-like n=1 Tax=Herpailurus yagouaroundi TaxID=1608482 RepID=UPI001AD77C35|nr:cerebral cavernous malformations 2 protein-like [Puma yagouaroundi]